MALGDLERALEIDTGGDGHPGDVVSGDPGGEQPVTSTGGVETHIPDVSENL